MRSEPLSESLSEPLSESLGESLGESLSESELVVQSAHAESELQILHHRRSQFDVEEIQNSQTLQLRQRALLLLPLVEA